MSRAVQPPAHRKTLAAPKPAALGASDLYTINTFAQGASLIMNMAMAKHQKEINEALQIRAERMKAQQSREQTIKALEDSISKIDSEILKNRAKAETDVNKAIRNLLLGD